MEGANISLNGQYDHEASSDRWVRTDRLRVERQEKGVNCPPQWLPVLLASHQPALPTRRRRLVDSVFTSTADLRTAAQAYNANPTAAVATYGPLATWDVSAVTDMSYLFKDLKDFNADMSNWDTSGVTRMYQMFRGASAFNQPLGFDTSSVTTMYQMFYLASSFNQPLSFDTSSVTTMAFMFYVRSSPCPAPNLRSSPRLHAACTAVARRLPPPGTLHLAPHRMPCFRLSADRVGFQPAAELRHVQRHDHGLHVPSAPPICSQALPCTSLAPRSPATSRYSAPRPAPYALRSTLGSSRRRSTSR